jgi:signal transduction histidine kinase
LEERQRLARDLHDALTQSLYSMSLLASGYKRSLSNATKEEIHQWMEELNDIAQNALAELRLLLYELRPNALEQDGLQGALKRRLEAVEKRAGIHTTFEVHGGFRLPPEDEEHFYRIAQEALNNALQHARHQSIRVQIESLPNRFQLQIIDDGIGFDFDQVIQRNQHSGLSNMFARAKQTGAQLSIETFPGKGTKLLILKEYHHV